MSEATLAEAVTAWQAETDRLAPEILRDAVAYALAHMGRQVITVAVAEVERLKSELDRYQGRQVLYVTDHAMDTAAAAATDVLPGTVLRATDTGRELVLGRDGGWEPR